MANFSSTYPSTRPVFNADFSNAGRLDSRITFSRADTASSGNWSAATNSPGLADGSGTANQYYRVSAAGVQDLGSGSISFEVGDYIKYSGSVWFKTTQPISVTYWSNEKHLSSENLFKYSNDLGTGWVEDNLTFTSGQTAPDGGSDAYKVTENSANNEHRSYPTAAISTNGGPTTLSGHFKYIGRQWILFRLNDGSAYRRVWFDIQNGVLGTADTGITASITASGNGFYKCVATIATSNTSYLPVFGGAAANTSIVYTGSGADAFYVWGLQYNHNVGSVLNETSGQIHRAYAPTLKSVSTAGQPRFEYSPTDSASEAIGSSRGLLIEGQSTNLLGSSADFGGSWQIINSTKEIAAVGPDGTLSAIAFREGTNSLEKRLLRYYTGGGGSVTISIYAKLLGNARRLVIREANASAQYATFDLATGTVVSGFGSIESVGNGWYRCQLNLSTTGTVQAAGFTLVPADGNYGNREYAGDGYSGLLLAHPQAENQSWASSYIDSGTSGSTATRAADSASTPIASTGYSGNNGTMLVEVDGGYGANPCAVALHDGAGYERAMIMRDSSTANDSTDFLAFVGDKSGTSSTLNLSGSGSASKVAVSFATNDFAATAGGGTVVTSTSGVSPAAHLTTLQIGAQIANNPWNGHIKRVALYSEALSDSNLISLTK
jgi:hypothetical protein